MLILAVDIMEQDTCSNLVWTYVSHRAASSGNLLLCTVPLVGIGAQHMLYIEGKVCSGQVVGHQRFGPNGLLCIHRCHEVV